MDLHIASPSCHYGQCPHRNEKINPNHPLPDIFGTTESTSFQIPALSANDLRQIRAQFERVSVEDGFEGVFVRRFTEYDGKTSRQYKPEFGTIDNVNQLAD